MANILLLAETDGAKILAATLPAVTFAQQLAQVTGSGFEILLVGGPEIGQAAEAWRGYGAERVLVASAQELAHPTADRVAAVCVQAMTESGTVWLAGTSSAFGRDILPRVAGLRDLPMLSDVLWAENDASGLIFRRPMYAGNLLATVRIEGENGVFSVRGTAFGAPATVPAQSEIAALNVDTASLPQETVWIGLEASEQKRPDLTAARVVVSGGRPLRDAETFERVLGGLADKLGGTLGATRAAVDSGIAPNELQVGQTGKIVAPELYIAAGVSGSVQHLAGMKESKVIVAINTDSDAPIFEVADYGLVADLHQAIPELTAKL